MFEGILYCIDSIFYILQRKLHTKTLKLSKYLINIDYSLVLFNHAKYIYKIVLKQRKKNLFSITA